MPRRRKNPQTDRMCAPAARTPKDVAEKHLLDPELILYAYSPSCFGLAMRVDVLHLSDHPKHLAGSNFIVRVLFKQNQHKRMSVWKKA